MFDGIFSATEPGKTWLTENWRLCKPLESADDVAQVKNWASEVYVSLAMVNYPYPADFLAPLPANPIKVCYNSCVMFTRATGPNVLCHDFTYIALLILFIYFAVNIKTINNRTLHHSYILRFSV